MWLVPPKPTTSSMPQEQRYTDPKITNALLGTTHVQHFPINCTFKITRRSQQHAKQDPGHSSEFSVPL